MELRRIFFYKNILEAAVKMQCSAEILNGKKCSAGVCAWWGRIFKFNFWKKKIVLRF